MRITDNDVFECDDREELEEMLADCEESIADMEMQIATRRRLDTATDDWLSRVSSAVCHTERVIGLIREKLDGGE